MEHMKTDLAKQKEETFNKQEEVKQIEQVENSIYGFDDY